MNVVARCNEAHDFLCYGRPGVFATKQREQQEITTLALQLLQNCLMLINTLLVEKMLEQHQFLPQLTDADRRCDVILLTDAPFDVAKLDWWA